jgi:hypothetical protein
MFDVVHLGCNTIDILYDWEQTVFLESVEQDPEAHHKSVRRSKTARSCPD